MIIATAGHVDHGKTSLIRQLTGVDTDRLAEEKRRGLSINLGYAYLARDRGNPLGFIDVPGHHRFINTMIAGISGIDIGLLVVAADDGPMPQTAEHIHVLHLLGVERVILVVSKIDRVATERVTAVQDAAKSLLADHGLECLECFAVDNVTTTGIAELRQFLLAIDSQQEQSDMERHFYLSTDRAFTLKGVGLVVTGTVALGTVQQGDTLRLLPGNRAVRVRGLRVHDESADHARAGQRVALNITGEVELGQINRGDWLVGGDGRMLTQRLDVLLKLLPDAPFALKHLAPVKLYLGSKRVAGRVMLLESPGNIRRLSPGAEAFAQLILDEEIACYARQKLLIRDHAENHLLGGGVIVDPAGHERDRSNPARLQALRALDKADPVQALQALIDLRELIDVESFCRAWHLPHIDDVLNRMADIKMFKHEQGNWLVREALWRSCEAAILDCLTTWHNEHRHEPGVKPARVVRSLAQRFQQPLVLSVLTHQIKQRDVDLQDGFLRLPDFLTVESDSDNRRWQQVEHALQTRRLVIPLLNELAELSRVDALELQTLLKGETKRGRLYQISARRYALPATVYELAQVLLRANANGETITVKNMKSQWGIGRNLAVEVLEYFDGIRYTQRIGDERKIIDAELPERLFSR